MTEAVRNSLIVKKEMYRMEPTKRRSTSVTVTPSNRLDVNLPVTIVLPDGTEVLVRATSTRDTDRLGDMFRRSSPETIYRRFHSPYPQVPEWALTYLTGADGPERESLVAVVGGEIVGHVMYGWTEGGSEAEVAIVVEDAWQRRGIGRLLLLNLVVQAKGRGIEVFTGYVLGDNLPMLAFIRAVLGEVKYDITEGLYMLRAPLRALRTMYETEVLGVLSEGRPRQDGHGEHNPVRPELAKRVG